LFYQLFAIIQFEANPKSSSAPAASQVISTTLAGPQRELWDQLFIWKGRQITRTKAKSVPAVSFTTNIAPITL
jgi:hypothetical protein